MNKKLVIFDLDGTLLDTIGDLAAAVNRALQRCGFPCHPQEAYRFFVGSGINKLFQRALPEEERTEENVARIRAEFVPWYDLHNADLTKPYAGVSQLLDELGQRGVKMAIASNKYQSATEKLVAHYFPQVEFCAILGHREGKPVKPSPEIVEEILALSGIAANETLYVGDSDVDMLTATNAGVDALGVAWGFRPKEELVANGAKAIAEVAEDILRHI